MSGLESWLRALLSPPCVVAVIAIAGCLIGRIRLFGVSLDLAGVLFAAVLCGVLFSHCGTLTIGKAHIPLYGPALAAQLQSLSGLGTALFLAAVGLLAGDTVPRAFDRRKWQFLLTGMAVVLTGCGVTVACLCLDPAVGPSAALGFLAGALTSTPALAAASECAALDAAALSAGYGGAYLFGVAGVVLFVQVMNRNPAAEPPAAPAEAGRRRPLSLAGSLLLLFVTVAAGSALGGVSVPGLGLSLGASGGILVCGLLLGSLCAQRGRCPAPAVLPAVRSLGLIFFLIGMGVPAGLRFAGAARPIGLLYGAAATSAAIAAGWLCARRLFHMTIVDSSVAVCGGMTSTPAIGVLCGKQAGRVDLSAYATAYTGALFTLLLAVRLLCALYTLS